MFIQKITDDGRLWSVHYSDQRSDELTRLFNEWNNPMGLYAFFKEHWIDIDYFHISSIEEAIEKTLEESEVLETVVLGINSVVNLDSVFRNLSNYTHELYLRKTKGKISTSWLRLYAIRLASGIYIITGGAIKLTATMEERKHTRQELYKIEKVRSFLIEQGIIDEDGFFDYIKE